MASGLERRIAKLESAGGDEVPPWELEGRPPAPFEALFWSLRKGGLEAAVDELDAGGPETP